MLENYLIITALIGAAFLLLLPGYLANKRKHPYRWIIWALALTAPVFFGVTWFIALIWVLWPQDKNIIDPVVQGLGGNQRTTGDTISEFVDRYRNNSSDSVASKLAEIDDMRAKNLISDEEYEKLRKKALKID
jgi:cytoskeletal protein RodZ